MHENGARREIAVQRSFGAGGRPLRSVSCERRPDLTLEIKVPAAPG